MPDPTLWSEPEEYQFREVSAEAGAHYFTVTGSGDPYGAGLPYPVFLALLRDRPSELGGDFHGFSQLFGTLTNPDGPDDPYALPVGFHLTRDPNTGVDFLVTNCQLCHTNRLSLPDGVQDIVGMGNRSPVREQR